MTAATRRMRPPLRIEPVLARIPTVSAGRPSGSPFRRSHDRRMPSACHFRELRLLRQRCLPEGADNRAHLRDVYLTDKREHVERYAEVMNRLSVESLTPDDSVTFIRKLLAEDQ